MLLLLKGLKVEITRKNVTAVVAPFLITTSFAKDSKRKEAWVIALGKVKEK